MIRNWYNNFEECGVPSLLIIGYELFTRLLVAPEDRRFMPKNKKTKARELSKADKQLERKKPEFRKYLQGGIFRYKVIFVNRYKDRDDPTSGPNILVADEGHRLKNYKTCLYQIMLKVVTKKRVFLTGTPMQNNLTEVNFIWSIAQILLFNFSISRWSTTYLPIFLVPNRNSITDSKIQ